MFFHLTPYTNTKVIARSQLLISRIKSATSDELPAAREGRTPLTTITMKDARSIWILTLVGQHGLPSKKVTKK